MKAKPKMNQNQNQNQENSQILTHNQDQSQNKSSSSSSRNSSRKSVRATQAPATKGKVAHRVSMWRRSSNVRIAVIVILMLIVALLFFFWGKFRVALVGIFMLLLVALGMEVSGNDWDLGKLWETGSLSESKIEKTESGLWVIGADCDGTINYNCGDFAYQEDAQDYFERCGGVDNDVSRLDADKDGIACEGLRKRPKN